MSVVLNFGPILRKEQVLTPVHDQHRGLHHADGELIAVQWAIDLISTQPCTV